VASPEILVSLRGVLVLALLLAGVVGLLYWLGGEPPKPDAATPAVPLLAAFQEGKVREIDATCAPGTWTIRRGVGGGWRVETPFAAEADPRRVHAVLAGLADATAVRTVAENGADAAAFGLEPPACTIRLTVDSEPTPRLVRLGHASPVGSERYGLAPDGSVVLVEGSLFETLSRDAETFRERRFFPVDATSVTRIVVDRPGERLELVSEGDAWHLVSPVRDEAATASCESLARAIESVSLGDVGGTKRTIVPRPDRTVRIEVNAGPASAPLVGYLATAGVGGTRLGWRDGGSLLGLVPERVAQEIEQGAATYRSKRVALFSLPDVRSVAIERGAATFRVNRESEGGTWAGGSGATVFSPDAPRVEEFLARLQRLRAVGFEPAGAAGTPTGSVVVGGSGGELCRFARGGGLGDDTRAPRGDLPRRGDRPRANSREPVRLDREVSRGTGGGIVKVLIQRVSRAAVTVDGATVGSIARGLTVFIGVEKTDTRDDVDWFAAKTAALRIFADGEGRMNLSVGEAGGEVLVVSQFTLAASTRRGNRPSFDAAADPERAQELYLAYVKTLRALGLTVATGTFRAMMEVELVNDRPVTIMLEPKDQKA
jgi:D-tyrosyl-tRNA(Tyr) deacylase